MDGGAGSLLFLRFLCRSAELIQKLVKLAVDTGVLAHLHDGPVCFSHFLHKLVNAALPPAARHGLGHKVKLFDTGFLKDGLILERVGVQFQRYAVHV